MDILGRTRAGAVEGTEELEFGECPGCARHRVARSAIGFRARTCCAEARFGERAAQPEPESCSVEP
eukprot:7942695-Alexandrium_andersonii.AAC.1